MKERNGREKVNKDLNQALKEWQEAMRLQDWDITAELLSNAEYEYRQKTASESACVSIDRNRMMDAKILIKEDSEDKEFSLLHELGHIMHEPLYAAIDQLISMLPGKECQKIARGNISYEMEILVNKLARAFLRVRDMAHETPPSEPEKPEITE